MYIDEKDNNKLKYNAGRELSGKGSRTPCKIDMCLVNPNFCDLDCQVEDHAWNRITNTKAFLTAGIGLQSWKGRMEVSKFEAHDVGLAVEALQSGFWINNMLVVCRTGEKFEMPDGSRPNKISGNGFKFGSNACWPIGVLNCVAVKDVVSGAVGVCWFCSSEGYWCVR